MRFEVLGIGFDNITPEQAADRAIKLMESGGRGYVATPNPEIVELCRRDPEAAAAVNGAFLVLPDGIGIVYAAKILGHPIKTRAPGIEFAEKLMERMDGKKLFLLGARPGVAQRAAGRLAQAYPGLEVCGFHDGYFPSDEPVLEQINAAGADVVLVCLGAPKQELWMRRNIDKTCACLMAGLGGALDAFSGDVKRAPEGWRRLGLEWLYRGLSQPARFSRIMKLPVFLLRVLAARGKKRA